MGFRTGGVCGNALVYSSRVAPVKTAKNRHGLSCRPFERAKKQVTLYRYRKKAEGRNRGKLALAHGERGNKGARLHRLEVGSYYGHFLETKRL